MSILTSFNKITLHDVIMRFSRHPRHAFEYFLCQSLHQPPSHYLHGALYGRPSVIITKTVRTGAARYLPCLQYSGYMNSVRVPKHPWHFVHRDTARFRKHLDTSVSLVIAYLSPNCYSLQFRRTFSTPAVLGTLTP